MVDRAAIRDYARELTLVEAGEWSDAKVNNVINQAVREVGNTYDWPFLEAESTITFTDTQAEYALPADFSRLIVVLGDEGEELDETTRRAAQKRWLGTDGGTPQEYYFWKEQLVFAPTPNSSSFPSVVVDYIRTPTELANDTDTPEWHSAFHLILADYAAAKMWEQQEDFFRSNFYMHKFHEGVRHMVRHYRNRGRDGPLIVGGDSLPDPHDPQRPFMTWLQPYP